MRFNIDINYPPEKMEISRLRMEARLRRRSAVRPAPVNYCIVARYFAPIFKLRYLDFFKDVETQYYWQLSSPNTRSRISPAIFAPSRCSTSTPISTTLSLPARKGPKLAGRRSDPCAPFPPSTRSKKWTALRSPGPMQGCGARPSNGGSRCASWPLKPA